MALNSENLSLHIYTASFEELSEILADWGEPEYRVLQLWQGLYRDQCSSFDDLTTLPQDLRKRLHENFRLSSLLSTEILSSKNKETLKYLFATESGEQFETVLMHYDKRKTACISTQSGCAMGCVFCATGQMGLIQNLTSGEIVEQVITLAQQLKKSGSTLTNIVVMGMGEPFHNYEATMKAMDILNHRQGFHLGARRITISTVGLIPMIERFTRERRRNMLAVSLHAATQDLREKIVPISARHPLDSLMEACRNYIKQSGRRITFEWALIKDLNDGMDQAQALVELVDGMLCHINLIPLNPTRGYGMIGASQAKAEEFRDYLISKGLSSTVRVRRGIDIQAGCGQLAAANRSYG